MALKISDLPPSLQKILLAWIEPENWSCNLKEICEKTGVKYKTAKQQIWRVGSLEFYQLRADLTERAMLKAFPVVIDAVYGRAKKGHVRAAEVFLKVLGKMKEKVSVDGELDLNFTQKLLEAKKKAQELEK